MKRFSALFFLVCIVLARSYAQGEIDTQEEYFYQDERTWSGHIRTNGIGATYRYAKRIDGFRKTLYLVQFDYIKDKKEKRITTTSTYNTFVYGKLNYFYSLKGGIGLQRELYSKLDVGSVSIRYFYNFGLSLGVLKPIYYEVYSSEDGETTTIKFDETVHGSDQFEGKAPYIKGITETTVVPGVYGKVGATFEYSKRAHKFKAIEVGVQYDAYLKRIPIMYSEDSQDHQFSFPSFYLAVRFGKVIDSQFKGGENKVDRLLTD